MSKTDLAQVFGMITTTYTTTLANNISCNDCDDYDDNNNNDGVMSSMLLMVSIEAVNLVGREWAVLVVL